MIPLRVGVRVNTILVKYQDLSKKHMDAAGISKSLMTETQWQNTV